MKRVYLLAATMVIAYSCATESIQEIIPDINSGDRMTIAVATSSDNGTETRIAISEDVDSSQWITEWSDGDKLGGYSSEYGVDYFELFEMDEFQKKESTFSGRVADQLRLVYPYCEDSVIDNGRYMVDLSSQKSSMAEGSELYYMGQYTHMISNIITSGGTKPAMSHVGAAMELQLQFPDVVDSRYTIRKVALGGEQIPISAYLDLEKEVDDDNFMEVVQTGSISVEVEESPVLNAQDVYTIKFNILPFTVAQQASVVIELFVYDSADDKLKYLTMQLENGGESAVLFERATYNHISKLCYLESAAESPYFGQGTEENPYEISSAAELRKLADEVNGGESYGGKYFALTHDIYLEGGVGNEWTPIGNMAVGGDQWNDTASLNFDGVFDGNGHTIKGLYIDDNATGAYSALFGLVRWNSEIKNLTVEGVIKSAVNSAVAGVVGCSLKSVDNCHFEGEITADEVASGAYVAGVVGFGTTISNSSNSATIKIDTKDVSAVYVGGVVGNTYGSVLSCGNSGDITVSSTAGANKVGGIAGGALNVDSSYNQGDINCSGDGSNIGGILGEFKWYDAADAGNRFVTNSYNSGKLVNSASSVIGGVVGAAQQCAVINCYNIGAVSTVNETDALSGAYHTAGIVGYPQYNANTVIENCYNAGIITYNVPSGAWTTIGAITIQNWDGTLFPLCYYLDGCEVVVAGSAGVEERSTKLTDEQMTNGTLLGYLNGYKNDSYNILEWTSGDDEYPIIKF